MFPPESTAQFQFATRGAAGIDSWDEFRWKLQHVSMFTRTAPVWRGPRAPLNFPRAGKQLDLQNIFVDADKTCSVESCLKEGHTESVIILHKGVVILEKYFNDSQAHVKQPVWSVSKSLVGVVVANLVEEGVLKYESQLTSLLPELKGSVWEGVTVKHALMQASGVKSCMSLEPGGGFFKDLQALGLENTQAGEDPPRILDSVRNAAERLFASGSYFDYGEANPQAVAWACQRLTGMAWPDLVSKYVWRKIGAAEDAQFIVDRAGSADAAAGFACTPMDLARYAHAIMHSDDSTKGRQLCPFGYFQKIQQEGSNTPGTLAANDPNNILNGPFMDELLGYTDCFLLLRYGNFKTVVTSGLMCQMAVMQPDLDVVIVRMGSSMAEDDLPRCCQSVGALLSHIAVGHADGL